MTQKKKRSLSTKKRQEMNNKPFEFNQATPNRYIAHFCKKCTVSDLQMKKSMIK